MGGFSDGFSDGFDIFDAAPVVVLTNGASQYKIISSIAITNRYTSSVTINFYVVPNDAGAVGSVADSLKVIDSLTMAAKETIIYDDNLIILDEENDTLQIYPDKASVINVHLTVTTKTA